MSSSAPPLLYALDFDGVLCDSVNESTLTAFRAALHLWPDLPLPRPPAAPAPHLLAAMRDVRPVVETGYENILLARLLAAVPAAHDLPHAFVHPVLHDWPRLRDQAARDAAVSKDRLVEVFGRVRDDWIRDDLDGWIRANRMFPGVVDALNFAAAPVYIITTKQTRFCELLLRHNGVNNVSRERIFGLGTGSKISVLKQLLAMPENAGKEVCFVEDRYETLEAVSISMLGQPLQLFLATWGYNTEKTRKVAGKHPFIDLLDLQTFVSKFQ